MTRPTEEEIAALPASFSWKGLRYSKQAYCGDSVARYECKDMTFPSWVRLEKSGQWIAAFTNGVCSIERDCDGALEVALRKHAEYLLDRYYEATNLLMRDY